MAENVEKMAEKKQMNKELEILVTFLQRTRDGDFAPIDETRDRVGQDE